MEPDPIGLDGGLNPYAYAGSNPVMNVDQSGLLSELSMFDMSNYRGLENSFRMPNIGVNLNIPINIPSLPNTSDIIQGLNNIKTFALRVSPYAMALNLTGDSPQKFTPIYRAMSQVELGRTMKYGYQPNPGGMEVKQFVFNTADAYRLVNYLPTLDAPEKRYNYTVVTSMISTDTLRRSSIDSGIDVNIIHGKVLSVPNYLLPQLNRDARATGGIKILPPRP